MVSAHERGAEVLVLGGGLQGACVALGLAHLGHRVAVLDRAARPMSGASRHNEGKIHLGFVYALDSTHATQEILLAGAVAFGPLVDRWLGPQPWDEWRTSGFQYAVMPESLLSGSQLEEAYAFIGSLVPKIVERTSDDIGESASYLGRPLRGVVERQPCAFDGCSDAYLTEEVAIDPDRLADAVLGALGRHPLISLHMGQSVERAHRGDTCFTVEVAHAETGEPSTFSAPIVVNALWEGRTAVDDTLGLRGSAWAWTYRTKYQVVVQPRRGRRISPVTLVQGPFGDVIPWTPERVCLSWYPTCRTELRTTNGNVRRNTPDHNRLATTTLETMAAMFPALHGSTILDVRSGTIVAPGSTDIDDPLSRLHVRSNPSLEHHDGWWTIDTGKLTMAPLLAHLASAQVHTALQS